MATLSAYYRIEFHWNFCDVVIDVNTCTGYGHYHTQATPVWQSHMCMTRGAVEAYTTCPF